MRFDKHWIANEEQLLREADSLGLLLARIKGHLSSLPIADQEWQKIFETAHRWPPTLAGFPLWIGVPMTKSESNLQLDMSILGGTRSARFFLDKVRSKEADSLTAALASVLETIRDPKLSLQQIAGDRVLLHCVIARQLNTQAEGDGIYLYPVAQSLGGDNTSAQRQNFDNVLDALTDAVDWRLSETERRLAECIFANLGSNMRIGAIGVIPQHSRFLQVTVLGFKNANDIISFMKQVKWPGQHSNIASLLDRLAMHNAFSDMQLGVKLIIRAGRLEPTLELQVFSADTIYDSTGWFKDEKCWDQLIDALRKERLVDSDRLSGLTAATGAKIIFGRSGSFALLKRIHHFAFELNRDDLVQVNAHLFILVTRYAGAET